ncbi:hypothetical protein HPB47_011587 [Ixodes persulcatus]|uniref:Uncharacterized protein n=1 Tax=Ixodes persulcatus TaxID=34615 RepID=A0AC60NVW0_IXOPE|nr:hypothetical protein HPB47_011587 [Ixodes persulcatus]
MQVGQRVLGRRLFRLVMRHTFYGHFVGGESADAIQPLVKRLRSFGVKSILDYSAEEDLSEQEAKQVEMAGCVSQASSKEELPADVLCLSLHHGRLERTFGAPGRVRASVASRARPDGDRSAAAPLCKLAETPPPGNRVVPSATRASSAEFEALRGAGVARDLRGEDDQLEPDLRAEYARSKWSAFGALKICERNSPSENLAALEQIGESKKKPVFSRAGSRQLASSLRASGGQLKQFQPSEQFADRRHPHVMARTYFYLNEAQCEKNMDTFLKCIDAVADATKGTGLAAIKLTALGRPQLLIQLSEVVVHTRKFFREVTGADKAMALSTVTPSNIEQKVQVSPSERKAFEQWLQRMDFDRNGLMNIFSWSGLYDPHLATPGWQRSSSFVQTGRMEPIISALTEEEEEMFRNMMRRVHTIARTAQEKSVRVMVDAEQTYFQPGISRITMELMRKYNREKAIIFNTYQCYLRTTYDHVVRDLELARRQGFFFGAKLVRGAYMEQERLRAKTLGYEDPINATYEDTNATYHKTLTECLRQVAQQKERKTIAIMVASHNEDTVRFAVKQMQELGIQPADKVVCFGQLLGMCDQVSFPLGQAGYSVYKYVPYGPIDEVMPYLSRRAVENHSLLQKLGKELGLLRREIGRRLLTGQLFYKPRGNYTPI